MDVMSTLDCSSWDSVKKVITCTYCKGLLKKPYTLICCHTFCCSCIESIMSCPTCQPNEVFSFKLLKFENHFIARLTKVFMNRQKCDQSSCTTCKNNPTICKRCYIIGCIKCSRKSSCIDSSKQHVSHPVNLNSPPNELLHLFSATGQCEQHENYELTSYCYKCKRLGCFECFKSCTSHKTSKLENHNKSFTKLLVTLDKVKEQITKQTYDFEQHKEKLDKLFKEDFEKVEEWFKHAYNCLYHEKQNTIHSLEVFQRSIDKRVERFKSDLDLLTQSANDFQTYFTLLLDKSSDYERYMYKKNSLEIAYRVNELENDIQKIKRRFESNLDSKKVFQKFFTRTITCEGIASCDVKCKKVDNLRSHLNIEQKYKYEVISYCQALNEHDKFETDPLVIKGNCYSMFSLPHVSSELVKCAKQQLTDISKCASCVSQLKLYNRAIAQQDVDIQLKYEGNRIYESIVISSIEQLLEISHTLIHNTETGILHLHEGNISMYFQEIKKNFAKLESFATTADHFQKLLKQIFCDVQSFQTNCMNQPSNIIHSNILINIVMDCQMYITSVHQIVINICHTRAMIELVYNENGEGMDDETTKCISNEGFQVEIVSHYSTCVALNEICKTSIELIKNWIN